MSEQEQTSELVNNELTERVNDAFIGSVCKLMRGEEKNWVMMECTKNDKTVDVLFGLDEMEEMVAGLKKELASG